MEQGKYNALHLRAEGEFVLLEMEINKEWVTLIKERLDSPFSHIIEGLGIENAIKKSHQTNNP